MVNKDFFAALEELGLTKGIDKETFFGTLESALSSAYKRYAGDAAEVKIKWNEEKNSLKFYATTCLAVCAAILPKSFGTNSFSKTSPAL